jgi:hypothetical protein
MKRVVFSLITVLFCTHSIFSQDYQIIDSVSRKGIFGIKLEAREKFESSKGQMVDNKIKVFWGNEKTNKVSVKAQAMSHAAIVYFKVSHPDYFPKEIAQDAIIDNTIELVRNGITEEFCIKLFTVKEEISEAERIKLKNLFNVQDIQKITRKDGRFAYITTPIKNLYKSIDQLERLKATKNPMIQDGYLLYAKTKMPVHFRIQLAVAHEWMVNEFDTPSKLLENRYKIKQLQTDDSLFRVVSEMKYSNYADAVRAFSEKVRVRLTNPKAVIIACTLAGDKEKVITPMSL